MNIFLHILIFSFLYASMSIFPDTPDSIIYATVHKNITHAPPCYPSTSGTIAINPWGHIIFTAIEPASDNYTTNNLRATKLLPLSLNNSIASSNSYHNALNKAFQKTAEDAPEEDGYYAIGLIIDFCNDQTALHYGEIAALKTIIAFKKNKRSQNLSIIPLTNHTREISLLTEGSLALSPRKAQLKFDNYQYVTNQIIPYIDTFDQEGNAFHFDYIKKNFYFLDHNGKKLPYTHRLGSLNHREGQKSDCLYKGPVFLDNLIPFIIIGSSHFWKYISEQAVLDFIEYWLNQEKTVTCGKLHAIAQKLIDHVDNAVQEVRNERKSMFLSLIFFNWNNQNQTKK